MSPRSIPRAAARILALAAAFCAPALLYGCSTQIMICPVAAILSETASMTAFKPGTSPDPANELYSVGLTNAKTTCSYNRKEGSTSSDLTLHFHATRPPSARAAAYSVPYFVVVSENAKLYDKKIRTLRFSFAPGAVSADIDQDIDNIVIKIANGRLPWNYELMSGMQLTADQVAYNQKMRGYLP